MSKRKFSLFHIDEKDLDDALAALSTGMDEEEEYEEEDEEEEVNQEADPNQIKLLAAEIEKEDSQPPAGKTEPQKQPQPQSQAKPQPQPQKPQQQPPQPQKAQPQKQPQSQTKPQPQPQKPQQQPPQPQKAQPQKQPQSQAKPQPQPQKPQQQPPQKPAQQKPHPSPQKPQKQPAPKPAPVNYINETGSSEDYNQLFEIFTDTFYSMLHSESHKQKYFDQIEKLLPIITEGPSNFKGTIDVSKPSLKAPEHRNYEEFKKQSISTAKDQKEVDKIIKEIEESIEILKKAAKSLLSFQCRSYAKYVYSEIKALQLSMVRIREEPYYVMDVFNYFTPLFEKSIPENIIRINLISGSGFPKEEVKVVLVIPLITDSGVRVEFEPVKGPEPKFNCQKDISISSLNDPKALKYFQKAPSLVGVYVGKKDKKDKKDEKDKNAEPDDTSIVRTSQLLYSSHFSCPEVAFKNIPGATLNIEFSTHHGIMRPDMKPEKIEVKLSPFVCFEHKPNAAAGAKPAQKTGQKAGAQKANQKPGAPQAGQKAGAQKAAAAKPSAQKPPQAAKQPPQAQPKPQPAQMRKPEEIKKAAAPPPIYIFTEEEREMFWPGNIVVSVTNLVKQIKEKYESKGEKIDPEIEKMAKRIEEVWKRTENAISSDEMDLGQYMALVEEALKREENRLGSIPDDFKQAHIDLIQQIKTEIENCKKQMEEEDEEEGGEK